MVISVDNLTSNVVTDAQHVVTGDGVLDKLMETVNKHLDAQFKLGRITGTDYATVYLGAMQSALQQGVAFTLGVESTNAEVALANQRQLTEVANTTQATNQAALIAQQEITEFAQTGQGTKVAPATDSVLGASIDKIESEVALLSQKEITEYAQTQVTTKVSPNTNSILGKQATLYGEQAKGFKWNADQKYLKTILDAWSINVSTAGVAATQVDAINATGTGNVNEKIAAAEPTG